MFYFPEVPKKFWVGSGGGKLGGGGGGMVKVGKDTANNFFYGRPNGSSVRIKSPSLGIIRIGYAASRVRS